jgi:hypothetical protein
MKLQRIGNDHIVTIQFGNRHYAVAEARELKRAGFGALEVTGGFWGEWKLRVRTLGEFKRLAKHIPQEWLVIRQAGSKT